MVFKLDSDQITLSANQIKPYVQPTNQMSMKFTVMVPLVQVINDLSKL